MNVVHNNISVNHKGVDNNLVLKPCKLVGDANDFTVHYYLQHKVVGSSPSLAANGEEVSSFGDLQSDSSADMCAAANDCSINANNCNVSFRGSCRPSEGVGIVNSNSHSAGMPHGYHVSPVTNMSIMNWVKSKVLSFITDWFTFIHNLNYS